MISLSKRRERHGAGREEAELKGEGERAKFQACPAHPLTPRILQRRMSAVRKQGNRHANVGRWLHRKVKAGPTIRRSAACRTSIRLVAAARCELLRHFSMSINVA